jgi:hypothetical protein
MAPGYGHNIKDMFSCSFWERTCTDPATFWTAATSVITALLAWVAWRQLGSLAGSSTSDFLFRLKSDFFTEQARKLVFLIEHDLLKFEEAGIPYFSIPDFSKPELKPRLQEVGITEPTISTYLFDDIILGPLEDVWFYLREKRITKNQAYSVFSYYIDICADCRAIQDYKKFCRSRPGKSDIYVGLDHLEKLMRQEEAARN